jgi:hypothetical protein
MGIRGASTSWSRQGLFRPVQGLPYLHILQKFRNNLDFGIPVITFPRTVREAAHSNTCGPLSMKRLEPLFAITHRACAVLLYASLLHEVPKVSAVSGLHKSGPVQVTALRACWNQEEGVS